jgi:hypothetical protein
MITTQSAPATLAVCDDSVVYTELDGEAVLLNVESGIYFGLDAIGTRIWSLIGEGVPDEQIHMRLLEEYDVAPEQVRADVADFIDALVAQGLVRRAG